MKMKGKTQMYFKILMAYLLGYVTIEVEGYYIERFMNICNNQKIFLWNIKRPKTAIMRVNISIQDFKKIKPIAKKTKCKIKIDNKKGVPFFFHRYQKRKIFFIFFLLVIIGTVTLSNFIWNIEITGTDKIDPQEIKQLLEENDFKLGKMKATINTKQVIDQIRLQRADIAWIGIEISGTNATVKIVEADLKPDIIPEEEYCNLIATKEGMITKISAQNGTPLIKEGEIVKKGSVLVGGWLEGKYTGTRYVHANGEVQAKVWYSEKIQIPFNQEKKELTGIEEKKYSVKINNFEINFAKKLPKFENYDTIESTKKLRLFSDFYLPIEVHEKVYQEYQKQPVSYSLEEAKKMGEEELSKRLEEQIENKEAILDKKVTQTHTEEYVEVEVIYEVLENIATKEKIVF